jgi:competence protein CoiA
MKYSYVDGIKTEAFPKGKGFCICCNKETIAKCGIKNINHWAHKTLIHCDNWWENETEWHRTWKSYFPVEWHEVLHYDSDTGEKHIADVKTKDGVVIEFQNSPISSLELIARENFYKNMVWVVNGQKFKNRFYILDKLPNPKSELANNVRFIPTKYKHLYKFHFKISENPDYLLDNLVIIHSNLNIKFDIEKNYIGHHLFDWVHASTEWYSSNTNVFFDFGGSILWKLIFNYDDLGLICIRKIDKSNFINKALG